MVYFVLALIILVAIVVIIWFIKTYNNLVQLRNAVKDQWSQVDVQLKRRFDLIPNLVETVKGYAKHEEETFVAVINARNNAVSAKTPAAEIKANRELTGILTKLFALAESYPELKANENFKDLQSNLKETENKISFARQFYNDTVLKYKNALEMFPSNLIAVIFGFKSAEFFSMENDGNRINPTIDFS
jgi:LemA protein